MTIERKRMPSPRTVAARIWEADPSGLGCTRGYFAVNRKARRMYFPVTLVRSTAEYGRETIRRVLAGLGATVVKTELRVLPSTGEKTYHVEAAW